MRQNAFEDPGYFRDYDGNHCKDGDVLVHPDGNKFTLIRNGDVWLADYGDQSLSLSDAWLQVGSRGMAVKADEVGKKKGIEKAQSLLKAFLDGLKYASEKSLEVEIELSKRGWFFGIITNLAQPLKILPLIQLQQFDELDKIMLDEVKQRLIWIEDYLIKYNPKRERIIRESFLNHREGRYFSSACLLISQVDGICNDRFKQHFFTTANKKSKLAPHIEQLQFFPQQFKTRFFDELRAIDENTDRFNISTKLNRHNIVHGWDTEYGNEMNSLKIISFVNFINEIAHFDEIMKSPE